MLKEMFLHAKPEELAAEDSWHHVLRLQVSYFGEYEDFKGLLLWIRDTNPFWDRLISIADSFNTDNPRKPF
jgi:hypothetical protein